MNKPPFIPLNKNENECLSPFSSEENQKNNYEFINPIQNIAKYLKSEGIQFSENFIKTAFENDLNKILLFLFFFQKNERVILQDFIDHFKKENFKLVSSETFEIISGQNKNPIDNIFMTLANQNFYSLKLIEFACINSFDMKFIEIVLPLLDYLYFEIPKKNFLAIFKDDQIGYIEKLNWINSLVKHSKFQANSKGNSKIKTLSSNIKSFLKKNILKLQMHYNANKNEEKSNFQELIKKIFLVCLSNKYFYLINFFSKEFKNSFDVLSEILSEQAFNIFNKAVKKHKIRPYLETESAWDHILSFLESKKHCIQGFLMLCKIRKIEKLKMQQHSELITFLENFLNDDKFYYLLYCVNPILVLVKISLFCLKLSQLNTPLFKIYKQFSEFFRSLANQMFHKTVNNVKLCKIILFKVCYPSSEKLIELLFQEKVFFTVILSQEIILATIKSSITSKYQFDNNIFIASSSYNILKSSNLNYDLKINNQLNPYVMSSYYTEKSIKTQTYFTQNSENVSHLKLINVFKFLKTANMNTVLKTNHSYQFKIFIKTIKIRYILDFISYVACFYFIFGTFNQYNLLAANIVNFGDMANLIYGNFDPPLSYINPSAQKYQIMELAQIFNKENDERTMTCILIFYNYFQKTLNLDEYMFVNNYIENCKSFLYTAHSIINTQDSIRYALYLSLLLGSKFIMNIVYQIKVYKKFKFNYEINHDFLRTLLSVIILILEREFWSSSVSTRLILLFSMRLFCTMIIYLFWIAFIGYFELIEIFAVRIQMIKYILKDLGSFLLILLFVNVVFSSTAFSFFCSTVFANQNVIDALFFFLGVSFGNFDLEVNEEYRIGFSLIVIIFMFIVVIILFNLLIAILSNRYTIMNESSNMEYSHVIYEVKKSNNYNKKYGALVLFPIPINFIIIPFLPFFFRNSSQSINSILVKFGYFLVLLGLMGIFLLGNLFLILFCWLKVFYDILTINYKLNKTKKNPGLIIILIHFTSWLFAGLLYLLFVFLINDVPLFLKSAFKYCDNQLESLPINDYFFHLFINLVDDLNKKNIKTISYEEFYNAYLEILEKNSNDFRLNWMNQKFTFREFDKIQKTEIQFFLKRLVIDSFIDIDMIKIIVDNFRLTESLTKKGSTYLKLLNILNLTQTKKILAESKMIFKV